MIMKKIVIINSNIIDYRRRIYINEDSHYINEDKWLSLKTSSAITNNGH